MPAAEQNVPAKRYRTIRIGSGKNRRTVKVAIVPKRGKHGGRATPPPEERAPQ